MFGKCSVNPGLATSTLVNNCYLVYTKTLSGDCFSRALFGCSISELNILHYSLIHLQLLRASKMPSRFAAVTNKEILQLIKLAYSWQLLWKITALNRLSFSEVDKSLVLYRFFSRFFRVLWFKAFQDISIGVFQILKAFNAFVVMYLFYVPMIYLPFFRNVWTSSPKRPLF